MKKAQNITIFFSILSIIFSCNKENDKTKSSFSEFPNNVNMSEKLLDKFALKACYNPRYINFYDSLLILTQKGVAKGIFSFYSLKTHKLLASFGKQGKGPGEFIDPGVVEIDKEHGLLWFIDYPKTTFYAYKIKDILMQTGNLKPIKKIKFDYSLMPIFNYIVLKDTSILIPISSESNLCTIINSKGNIVKVYGKQPMFDSDGLPKQAYKDLHSRFIVFNEKENEIAFSYLYYDKLLKYNIKTNEMFVVTGPYNIKQKAQANEDGSLFTPITNIKYYFYTIRNNNEKIYSSYLGKAQFNEDFSGNLPHNIHVFDWDLKPVSNLIFNTNVRSFNINKTGDLLYVITTGDEKNIHVYKLD